MVKDSSVCNSNSSQSHTCDEVFSIVFWGILLSNGMGMELISSIEVAGLSTTVECWLVATPFVKPPCYWNYILLIQTQKTLSHYIIFMTWKTRPPRYFDPDFITQWWSFKWGSTLSPFHTHQDLWNKAFSCLSSWNG